MQINVLHTARTIAESVCVCVCRLFASIADQHLKGTSKITSTEKKHMKKNCAYNLFREENLKSCCWVFSCWDVHVLELIRISQKKNRNKKIHHLPTDEIKSSYVGKRLADVRWCVFLLERRDSYRSSKLFLLFLSLVHSFLYAQCTLYLVNVSIHKIFHSCSVHVIRTVIAAATTTTTLPSDWFIVWVTECKWVATPQLYCSFSDIQFVIVSSASSCIISSKLHVNCTKYSRCCAAIAYADTNGSATKTKIEGKENAYWHVDSLALTMEKLAIVDSHSWWWRSERESDDVEFISIPTATCPWIQKIMKLISWWRNIYCFAPVI